MDLLLVYAVLAGPVNHRIFFQAILFDILHVGRGFRQGWQVVEMMRTFAICAAEENIIGVIDQIGIDIANRILAVVLLPDLLLLLGRFLGRELGTRLAIAFAYLTHGIVRREDIVRRAGILLPVMTNAVLALNDDLVITNFCNSVISLSSNTDA